MIRGVFLFLSVLLVCPLAQWAGFFSLPDSPTPAPAVSEPYIEISTDATSISVGDTLTITGVPFNIGLPYYTLTISSGAAATITYDSRMISNVGEGYLARDDKFEIVSAEADMNRVVFVLRALASGSIRASISATGEVRTPEGAFMWGVGISEELTITAS